jgi:hypothetical protein
VPPEHTVGYLETLAYIYLNYKQPKDARVAAERAQSFAKNERDRQIVSGLLRQVDQWEQSQEQMRKFEEQRARLPLNVVVENPGGAPQPGPAAISIPTLSGKLRQVECAGQRATLHVFSGDRLHRFVIEDPASVLITGTGANGATAEFSCGPQKDVPVSVGHVDGVVRTLGFQ